MRKYLFIIIIFYISCTPTDPVVTHDDRSVLQDFINNSPNLNMILDLDSSDTIEPMELGEQIWNDNGRITSLSCYNIGLDGSIPESIGNLQNLDYLWIFNNNLTSLPETICDLNVEWDDDDYAFLPYFGAGGNQLCDILPSCIENSSNLNSSIDPLYYAFEITVEQECCGNMDLNGDGSVNIVDIVLIVNVIFSIGGEPTDEEICSADVNSDGLVSVLDIVLIINFIFDI